MLDPNQFAGGLVGILLAFLTAYVVITIASWRMQEDIEVEEFHIAEHQSLVQYVESQGLYVKKAFVQIWR